MFGPNFFGSFHSESCAKFFRGEAEAHPAAVQTLVGAAAPIGLQLAVRGALGLRRRQGRGWVALQLEGVAASARRLAEGVGRHADGDAA